MSETTWLGQPDLAWNVLLVAGLDDPPPVEVLHERLTLLSAAQRWLPPRSGSVVEGDVEGLVARFGELRDPDRPVSVGRTPTGLVLRAHHAHVDGLGMLAVLRHLAAPDLTSAAAGLPDRARRALVPALAGRLVEVLVRPPATLAARTEDRATGDVYAATRVARSMRTAELGHAAVQALSARLAEDGRRADPIALAVGVSTVGGSDLQVRDDSGFLRITDAQRLDATGLAQALDEAPLQVGGTPHGSARLASGAIRWASRRFASRLGSTVLVSHLGRVQAEGLRELAFYPMSGGASGLALGAATVAGSTTLTLRARAARHDPQDLAALLDDVVARLS